MVFTKDEIKNGIISAMEKGSITLALGWAEEIDWIDNTELICAILDYDWGKVKEIIGRVFE